eukprot:jgi/Bigna1/45060/e_gw1.110.30.1
MENDEQFENVPPHFVCPITQEIVKNPNVNEVGQTHECESIVEWFAMGHRTDPLTRKEIKNVRLLTPNQVLKAQMLEWKQS